MQPLNAQAQGLIASEQRYGSASVTPVQSLPAVANAVVADTPQVSFQAASGADQFQFVGYGTAAQGATFTNVDATHWSINSFDNSIHDIIALGNGQTVHASDYIFF